MPLNFDALVNQIDDALHDAMLELALEVEGELKQNHNWANDSGSFEDSITGFDTKKGDPDHNFNAPRWAKARAEGWDSPNYGYQPPEHYAKQTEPSDISEDNPAAIVTAYVPYSTDVEDESNVGDTFGMFGYSLLLLRYEPIVRKHLLGVL